MADMTLTAAAVPDQRHVRTRGFRAAVGVKWLGAFGAFGVSVSALYATTGIGFPCPLRTVTGWDCPLCGGTRLGESLLHGQLGAAFGHNPAVFLLLIVLTGLGVLWLVETAGGPALRPPQHVVRLVRRIPPKAWGVIIIVAAVGDTLARNLF